MHLTGFLVPYLGCNVLFVLGGAYATGDTNKLLEPNPRFAGVGYGGSGCGRDSLKSILLDTEQQVRISGHPIEAFINPSSSSAGSTFCRISISVTGGAGWQWALKPGADGFTTSSHNVSFELGDGVIGQYVESFGPVGSRMKEAQSITQLTGPLTKNVVVVPDYGQNSTIWSGCGSDILAIQRMVRLSSKPNTLSGRIRADVEFDISPSKSFEWRQCTS